MEEARQLLEEKVEVLTASRPAATVLEPGMARAPLDPASARHVAEPRPLAVRERPEAVPSSAVQGAQVMAARGPRREAVPEPSKPEW